VNFDFLRSFADLLATIPTMAWGSMAVVALGLGTAVLTNRDAWHSRKDAQHHLHEVNADTLLDIQKTAVEINTEVWNQLELPLMENNLRKEGETISLAATTDLLLLDRQVDISMAVVDGFRERGLTDQTFAEMMKPGSEIRVTTGPKRGGLSPEEAALAQRSLEGVRDNLATLDRHLKETYDILGLERSVSVWDAIGSGKLPDFQDWAEALLKEYPKALADIVRNNGAEAAQEVFRLLKERGELALSGVDRKEVRESVAKLEKSDAAARDNRELPGYEESPTHVVSNRRRFLPGGPARGRH
jgi:hypothetical protein